MRRIYGDRRVKGAMVRKEFKDWVEADFPRDPSTGMPPRTYFNRGADKWLKLPWEEAFKLCARALHNISATYSGKAGESYLFNQGYDPSTSTTRASGR